MHDEFLPPDSGPGVEIDGILVGGTPRGLVIVVTEYEAQRCEVPWSTVLEILARSGYLETAEGRG